LPWNYVTEMGSDNLYNLLPNKARIIKSSFLDLVLGQIVGEILSNQIFIFFFHVLPTVVPILY